MVTLECVGKRRARSSILLLWLLVAGTFKVERLGWYRWLGKRVQRHFVNMGAAAATTIPARQLRANGQVSTTK